MSTARTEQTFGTVDKSGVWRQAIDAKSPLRTFRPAAQWCIHADAAKNLRPNVGIQFAPSDRPAPFGNPERSSHTLSRLICSSASFPANSIAPEI